MKSVAVYTVGRLLVLTDMMGRRTHGLAMAPLYLAEIRNGTMRVRTPFSAILPCTVSVPLTYTCSTTECSSRPFEPLKAM